MLLDSAVCNWPDGCHGQPCFGQLYAVDGDFILSCSMMAYTVIYTEFSFRVVGVHRESILVWDKSRLHVIGDRLGMLLEVCSETLRNSLSSGNKHLSASARISELASISPALQFTGQ